MSSYLDGIALYIVIRTEPHQLWARLVSNRELRAMRQHDTAYGLLASLDASQSEDRIICIDTSYSPENFHNYCIGTYITVRNGGY